MVNTENNEEIMVENMASKPAEKKAYHSPVAPILVIILAVMLLGLAGCGAYYYLASSQEAGAPTKTSDDNIIPAKEATEEKELNDVESDLKDTESDLNTTDTDRDVQELEKNDLSGV